MKVGDVIRWNNFPDPRYSQPPGKARWFVCLGKTSSVTPSVMIYIHTTTTQIQHYPPGGPRARNPHLLFNAGSFGFEEPCVLDFSEDPYSYPESDINKNISNIEIKETLDKNTLIIIYNMIFDSPHIPKITKRIIRESLNLNVVLWLPVAA
ncbi:MAG: hypothetical protein NTX88_10090 [Candidatus Atribacteria bacterium]|nr:hypothetical protein [Candidatus Atribacteria bacterium]